MCRDTVGPKKQDFWPKIKQNTKEIIVFCECNERQFDFYRFFFSIKNNSSGAHFLLELFIDNFNFRILLFPKIMPNLWPKILLILYSTTTMILLSSELGLE